jgi:hypothetical protein
MALSSLLNKHTDAQIRRLACVEKVASNRQFHELINQCREAVKEWDNVPEV